MSAKPADRTEEVFMSSPTTAQKFTAEAIGTAILVFIGAGSVPLTLFLTGKNPFGSAELSTISFAFAFAIFAAVYAVGHISGAHINPAVTIALLATRKIDSRTAGTYIVAQLVGATLGAVLTYIILIGNNPQSLGLGAVSYNPDTSGVAVAVAAETIGTAILVFTVFGAAVDGRAPGGFAGIVIGFIVYGVIILVGPITGAALNPAREFGPDLVGSIIGATGGAATKWEQLPVYIVGPILGGLIGAFTYEFVGRHETAAAPVAAAAEAGHGEAVQA
jgi:glycerol uptake facilitator protein